jgi:hypothetical protein
MPVMRESRGAAVPNASSGGQRMPEETRTKDARLEEITRELEALNQRDPLDFWQEIKALEDEQKALEQDAA